MNEFQVEGKNDQVIHWLTSIDMNSLRQEVLEGLGWDDGDPISLTVLKLVEMAENDA